MWLLDTATFSLRSVHDPSQIRYAALSHVWNAEGEPSYQDIHTLHAEYERIWGSHPDPEHIQAYLENHDKYSFWSKISCACTFARIHGYQYVWIDTCCINKMSSAELSEAINSMFAWYAEASVCYVYLHDVPDHEHPFGEKSKFRSSKWFKRGWTLQELVAPRTVVFLSMNWTILGTKDALARVIAEITRISEEVLTHVRSLDSVSVSERMSWASERQTTRVEDEAYSLLGIFDIQMPTIYGEGTQAFIRLQEEILRRIPDQTLFTWGNTITLRSPSDRHLLLVNKAESDHSTPLPRTAYLFATSTNEFSTSTGLIPISLQEFSQRLSLTDVRPPQYITTSYGLGARFPTMTLNIGEPGDEVGIIVAPLACRNTEGSIPALVLSSRYEPNQYSIGGYTFQLTSKMSLLEYHTLRPVVRHRKHPRLIFLHPVMLSHLCTAALSSVARWQNVYVLYRPPRLTARSLRFALASPRPLHHAPFTGSCDIIIPRYTSSHLSEIGYYATSNPPMNPASAIAIHLPGSTHTFELYTDGTSTTLEYIKVGLSLCEDAHYPQSARPLHATVMDWRIWERPTSPKGQWSGYDISNTLSDCDRYHVQTWEHAERTFLFERLGKSIRLKFSQWYSDSDATPPTDLSVNTATATSAVIAMEIMVVDEVSQFVGPYSPTEMSSAIDSSPLHSTFTSPLETPRPSWTTMESEMSEPDCPSHFRTQDSEQWLMSPASHGSPLIPITTDPDIDISIVSPSCSSGSDDEDDLAMSSAPAIHGLSNVDTSLAESQQTIQARQDDSGIPASPEIDFTVIPPSRPSSPDPYDAEDEYENEKDLPSYTNRSMAFLDGRLVVTPVHGGPTQFRLWKQHI